MKIKHYTILLLLLITAQLVQAQHLASPKTYWQSYGYKKQPNYIKTAYYKSDSLGYEPTMAEVISFNKEGFIIQQYIQIMGKYASQTAHNYVYKNGVLDSINTIASNANFNTKQKLHYDEKGNLAKITAIGKYAEYTDTFTYNAGEMVQTIERKHKAGTANKVQFNHQKNYVHVMETATSGKVTESYFFYDVDNLFATFTVGENQKILFKNEDRRTEFEIEAPKNTLNYVFGIRKKHQQNPRVLAKLLEDNNGKIIFDIPAEARNENGDWIRRLQLDKRFANTERRLVFNQIMYADGTKSGSTEMDLIFESRVRKMK